MNISDIPMALSETYTNWSMVQKIQKHYKNKDWIGCISKCNELNSKVGNDMFGYLYLGLCNFELNFIEESSDILERRLND